MRRASGAGGCLRLAVVLLAGCASPDVICDFRDDGFDAVERVEVVRMGRVVLPPGDNAETRRFRVTVRGLSEIGTSHASLGSSRVRIVSRPGYGAGVPAGAELPDVTTGVGVVLPGEDGLDGGRPERQFTPELAEARIFACNGPAEEGCCEWDATECSVEVELRIARDDALFPQVFVDWDATFRAEFPRCSGEPPFELEVEEVTP